MKEGDKVNPQDYKGALEKMAFIFRDDDDMCKMDCCDCPLSESFYINEDMEDQVSYCDVLVGVLNNSKDVIGRSFL